MSHAFIPPDARSTFKYLSQTNLAQNPPTEATVLRGLAAPFFDFCFFASNTTIGSSYTELHCCYNLKRLLLHGRIELLAALLSSLSVSA